MMKGPGIHAGSYYELYRYACPDDSSDEFVVWFKGSVEGGGGLVIIYSRIKAY